MFKNTSLFLCLAFTTLLSNAEVASSKHQFSLGLGTLYGNANLDIGGIVGARYEYMSEHNLAPFVAIAPLGEVFSYKVGGSYYFNGENFKPRLSLSYGSVDSEYMGDDNPYSFSDENPKVYTGISIGLGFIYKKFTFDLTSSQITDTLTQEDKDMLIEESLISTNFGYVY